MRKLLLLITAITLIACKEEPKDYVTLSGKITDQNSDSIFVRSRTYTKTIQVNTDGTFKDTLKIEAGIYNFFDGKESTSMFLKNGFDINMTIDTKEFDESVKYSGVGSEHSNFLAKKALMQEKLFDLDALSNLDMNGLDAKFNEFKKTLTKFYDSNKDVDTLITNGLKKEIEPMLNFYKGYLAESIALKTELPKGSPSPVFESYENYKGGKTSLSDLKGKYVYVDVWATWCGPCIAEIPSLKKIEEAYHGKNIEFVSISVDDGRGFKEDTSELALAAAKKEWKKMITEKEMGGVQLFSDKGWQSDFVQGYKIKGIPRFILIDPNGNIVTPDAPRPSDASLTKLFTSLNI